VKIYKFFLTKKRKEKIGGNNKSGWGDKESVSSLSSGVEI